MHFWITPSLPASPADRRRERQDLDRWIDYVDGGSTMSHSNRLRRTSAASYRMTRRRTACGLGYWHDAAILREVVHVVDREHRVYAAREVQFDQVGGTEDFRFRHDHQVVLPQPDVVGRARVVSVEWGPDVDLGRLQAPVFVAPEDHDLPHVAAIVPSA